MLLKTEKQRREVLIPQELGNQFFTQLLLSKLRELFCSELYCLCFTRLFLKQVHNSNNVCVLTIKCKKVTLTFIDNENHLALDVRFTIICALSENKLKYMGIIRIDMYGIKQYKFYIFMRLKYNR